MTGFDRKQNIITDAKKVCTKLFGTIYMVVDRIITAVTSCAKFIYKKKKNPNKIIKGHVDNSV